MTVALFSRSDRIAIAVLTLLILAGWSIRLAVNDRGSGDDIRVIRDAVQPPESGGREGSAPVLMVDINEAAAKELERLPMIGPARAAAIIEYRSENGAFGRPEDIMKVGGIGEGIFERIRDHITVGENMRAEPGDGDTR